MAALAPADVFVPENFHEITGLRLIEIGKVAAEAELIKEARGSGTIGIPPAPDAFTIMLVTNDELIERREIELQLPAIAQRFDCLDENDVGRAGAEARIRRSRNDEKLSRFKMRGRLQFDRGKMRNGIAPAARHFLHLLED